MLYGKIYLDKDTDGRDMLVFVSLCAEGIEQFRACSVDGIAISPEARVVLLARLNSPDRRLSRIFGDFEFFAYDDSDHGSVCFKEDTVEDGKRIRTLRESDPFSVKVGRGCRRSVLEYMIPCDNELLRELDLGKSIDENTLWERYYAAMRERGEEPGCDVESIKKTPPSFLTEAQKEIIRGDYQARCGEFNDYHRINNPDAVYDFVIDKLMRIYSKSAAVIESIVGKQVF